MSWEHDIIDPNIQDANSNHNGGAELPNATATLVLGILSIVGCFLYSLPGLICGIIALAIHQRDKKLYESAPDRYATSYKNAKAGFVCAIIGVVLSGLYMMVFILAIVAGMLNGAIR